MATEPRMVEPSPWRIALVAFAFGTFAAGLYMSNALMAVWAYSVPHPRIEIVTRLLLLFWTWAPLAPLVWIAARRWPVSAPHIVQRLLIHLGAALGIWLLHALIYWAALNLRAWLDIAPLMLGVRWPPPKITQLVVLIDTDLVIYAVIVATASIWRNHARAVASRTWRDRVDSRRSTALLEALRRQLRPHFVLNALNMALSELVNRPKRARAVLTDLAALLESTERLDGHLVDLEGELDIVRAHAAIEQARFSDRLEVRWDITVPPGRVEVPPFAVQTLFENAVRHGLEQSRGPFAIFVEAHSFSGRVRIRVRDSGGSIAKGDGRGAGIALDNLRTRLGLLFGGAATLSLRVVDGWTVAEMVLPEKPV
ncbi:histidine kinase [Sphingomonas sp. G-3-2-10]|uniref:histidine kinase n=1 Tax=Sphingomonas sp. G-3-2-10 TaxID=2728838 RepID=UPI00146C3D28|nr:histidine kinase [Sphingomonas sp. G-3-2-10]